MPAAEARHFDSHATRRRELVDIFWINPTTIQESGHGYVKKLPDGRYEVCCKGQHLNLKNRNGRIYPTPTWARHLMPGSYFYEKIAGRRCVGQVEHPQTGRSSMDKGAIVITKAWIEEDTGELWIVFETMSTPHGKIVSAYLADGVGFGVSSRGNGSTMNNGEADIVQDDFDPVTWDTVLDESTPGAEIPAEMAMQAEARKRLAAWAKEEIERERKAILTETQGDEAAATLLASTRTEQMLVECYGGVCTIKRGGCECDGTCDPCAKRLTETMSGQGGPEPPKGYNELLLTTAEGAGMYRAYDDGQGRYDVWLMVHNLKPEQIATGLQTMKDAKKAAENHLQMIAPGREEPATTAPGSKASYEDPDVKIGGAEGGGDSKGGGGSGPVQVHVHVGEGADVKNEAKHHVSGSSVYLHQFEGREIKTAADLLTKVGFQGVAIVEDAVVVHTGYDDPEQAEHHVRRALGNANIELVESLTCSKPRRVQEGVEEIDEEKRQAKDAADDIDVPTYAWVGGDMVEPANNTGKNESFRGSMGPQEMMAMMAGFMDEMSRASMGETEDPAQGYPDDYGGDHSDSASPNGQGYPDYTSGVPQASGGYPGHPGHSSSRMAYEDGMQGYTEIKRTAGRDPSHGSGYYEDGVPLGVTGAQGGGGWAGDRGHKPNVGPATGQMAGPNTHPLQTTKPGFYEMGQMMAGMMHANYGNAMPLVPNMDDLALMLGYGFETTAPAPPDQEPDVTGPADQLGKGRPGQVHHGGRRPPPETEPQKDQEVEMYESGYAGYAPILDDPEDIDLDLDVNDPELNIDRADSGDSPYDIDSTDTVHGYSESLAEDVKPGWKGTAKALKKHGEVDNPYALANWMANQGYTSHRKADGSKKEAFAENKQEESTMRPGASPQAFGATAKPSYAFKVENRTNGSYVKWYFNEDHKLVEMREFAKGGKLLQRAGFCEPGKGIKAESQLKQVDPKTLPASVHETMKATLFPFVRGESVQSVFAKQLGEQDGAAAPAKKADVPDYDDVPEPGVNKPQALDPDSQRGGSADKAKKDAGGGAPSGSATTSTTQAEGKKNEQEEDPPAASGEEDPHAAALARKDEGTDEARISPKEVSELKDAIAEKDKQIEALKAEKDQLTKLVESMTRLQQQKDVQHKLESVLREHPELTRLKHKLEVCESVADLEKEAKEYLAAIHEATGYQPRLPPLDESEPPSSPPATEPKGEGAAGTTSASSQNTPGVPVGALAEGVTPLPALNGNGSKAGESTFSRAKKYRAQRGSRRR